MYTSYLLSKGGVILTHCKAKWTYRQFFEVLLNMDTAFTELLMGNISIAFGLWMLDASIQSIVNPILREMHITHILGVLLITCGLLKFIGICYNSMNLRVISSNIALFTWFAIASIMFGHLDDRPMAVALDVIMCVFNTLIYIKLYILRRT